MAHLKLHAIDSVADHIGVAGAVEDNIMVFNTNGLPKDGGLKISDLAVVNHTHVEADITDLDKYTQAQVDSLLALQDELSELGDVVITNVNDGEILTYDNGTGKWINETLAEAGVAAAFHTHPGTDVLLDTTSFDGALSASDVNVQIALETLDDAVAAGAAIWGNISGNLSDQTDLQAALDAQDELAEMNDVSITAVTDDEILQYDNVSGQWINQTLAEAGIASLVHTHVAADVTDFDSAVDGRITLQKGVANGLATLGGGGKIPTSQLPSLAITDVNVVANIAARDALVVQEGDVAKVIDAGSGQPETYIYDGSVWVLLEDSDSVLSVNGQTGTVVLDTDDVTEGSSNLYYTEGRVSANSDVAANTAARHTRNQDEQLRGGLVDTDASGNMSITGELKIRVFRQASQPALFADDYMAIWVDTDDSNRTYLMFRESSSNTTLVELAP
jgi:hypothetical protein